MAQSDENVGGGEGVSSTEMEMREIKMESPAPTPTSTPAPTPAGVPIANGEDVSAPTQEEAPQEAAQEAREDSHPATTKTEQTQDPDGDVAMTGTKSKPATVGKKKGTATTVKGPKQGKGGKKGGKASAASAMKKDEAGSTSSPTPGSDADEEEESDHGPYCICRGPDDHRWMIQCDGCEDWFHGECVNITKEIGETLIQSYICPNCTDDAGYVTRYKKTCSLKGCLKPARVYGAHDAKNSVFCSQEHCNAWWEQLVSTLPREPNKGSDYQLTQEQFMGLLTSAARPDVSWKLGATPFGIPEHFWSTVEPTSVLTPEEATILSVSAADRHRLGEEVMLNKKMLELLDLANERHRAAIAAGALEKDACGYDARLDAVGTTAQFAAFLASPAGRAIQVIPSGSGSGAPALLGPPPPPPSGGGGSAAAAADDPRIAGMCRRRKCKPHSGWFGIHVRQARMMVKELAREAGEKADRERRVRDAAARRFLRRGHEQAGVVDLRAAARRGGKKKGRVAGMQ